MRVRAAVLALCPLSVAAEAEAQGWQGDWAADPVWCANADRIGSVTPAPIRLTDQEFLGYENSCGLTGVTDTGLNAWTMRRICMSEGSVYEDDLLIMLDGQRLWMWTGEGAPVAFHRCPS